VLYDLGEENFAAAAGRRPRMRSTAGSRRHGPEIADRRLLPEVVRERGESTTSSRGRGVSRELGEMFDLVLVDTPPLLAVGDAMSVSPKVDAIVVVTHVGLRRPLLQELARELASCPAEGLGFVLTGVHYADGYGGYAHSDYYVPSKVERGRLV
jgi:hypothetical protein